MRFEEALAYLHGLQRFGMKPGLDRTRRLLERVGRPDRHCGKVVHVTGTSGKGSVAAMVESALRGAGHRVGLYTSPSLERFTDRIQINRLNVPEERLAALIARLRPEVEALVAEGCEQPTEFEVITTAAFLYFAEEQVDWLVLEVGLGGRFDSTTVIEGPVVTCITNIGLDHTEWLGPTHERIAWDKAGIIKPATPCVTGTEHPGALEVIRSVALEQDAVLLEVGQGDHRVISFSPDGQVVDLLGARGWYRGVRLSLLGRHQAANAAVALRVLELLGLGEEAIRAGLGSVVWPGRLELLQAGGRTVLLDAAHNEAKCQALAVAVSEYLPGRPVNLVLGVLADKDVRAMAQSVLKVAGGVWTVTPESPRALPAEELAEICRELGHGSISVAPSVAAGVDAALAGASPGGVVLITGSFYTIGPARRHLRLKIGQE